MSDFNLKQLIRDTIKTSKSPDPHIIAGEVASKIPPDHCEEVLAALLPDAVREQIRSLRNSITTTNPKPTQDKRGSNKSTKWEKTRDMAASPFTWRVAVPPDNTWKFLGDCTGYECGLIAKTYFDKASEITSNGNQYLRLSRVLDEDQTVNTLGEDEFWKIWKDN